MLIGFAHVLYKVYIFVVQTLHFMAQSKIYVRSSSHNNQFDITVLENLEFPQLTVSKYIQRGQQRASVAKMGIK